jgi:aspartyl-tRNA synthetase
LSAWDSTDEEIIDVLLPPSADVQALERERDELRAANERLAEQVLAERAQARTDLTMLRDERDELRAENKVLQLRGDTYLKQLKWKHAENERLRHLLREHGLEDMA